MVRFVTVLLLASVLVSQTSSPKLEPYEVAEAYEVYAAVISSQFPYTDSKTSRLMIRAEIRASQATSVQMCLAPDESSEEIIGSAIADYVQQNRQGRLLQRKFNLEKPYTLFVEDEKTPPIQVSPADPQEFHPVYPEFGGLIELSAVGFNADKTIAVVYYQQLCGTLCGQGEFHVLQKKAGKWQPFPWKGSSCTWFS